MRRFLVRVEAVNLASSIVDTDDLSVIRGGGFANLLVPERLLGALDMGALALVFAGASQAEAILNVAENVDERQVEARLISLASGQEDVANMEPQLVAILPHLTLLCAVVPYESGYLAASRYAIGKIRERQLMNLTIDKGEPPAQSFRRPCMVDGTRPGSMSLSKGGKKLIVSSSVYSRQILGRELRQEIYRQIGVRTDRNLEYADSFADLVNDPPPGLSPSLKGKMAVVYFDGNKFTAIRERAIRNDQHGGGDAVRAFSEAVTKARALFLDRILDNLENDSRMYCDGRRLRFEILMWGGDEARFVLPAWKLAEILPILADDMEGEHWAFRGETMTSAIGVLVCHHKMPITRAVAMADDIVDEIKAYQRAKEGKPENMLSIQLIESIEPHVGGIRGFRQKLYQTSDASAFVVEGASGLRSIIDSYRRITDPSTGLPRSQLYNLISEARSQGLPGQLAGEASNLEELLQTAVDRSRGENGEDVVMALKAALLDPAFGVSAGAPFVGLVRIAETWDLMRPFMVSSELETEIG
ncbi:hypothetical protein SAMN04515647_1833 [Cohaesibacter sp. ES.047]|nr:hypothetical protein SAMN04515647_1833 [Cohaesibacter sp. ES.047]